MADHLINIKVNLMSNADKFAADIRKQLREIDGAAKVATGARGKPVTPATASSRLAKMEGQALSQIQSSGRSVPERQAALGVVRRELDAIRRKAESTLGKSIPAPSQQRVLKEAGTAWAADNPNLAKNQKRTGAAMQQMANLLEKQVGTEAQIAAQSKGVLAAAKDRRNAARRAKTAANRQVREDTARWDKERAPHASAGERRRDQLNRMREGTLAGRGVYRGPTASKEQARIGRERRAWEAEQKGIAKTENQALRARMNRSKEFFGGSNKRRAEVARATNDAVKVADRVAVQEAAYVAKVENQALRGRMNRSKEFFGGSNKRRAEVARATNDAVKVAEREARKEAAYVAKVDDKALRARMDRSKGFFDGGARARADMERFDPNYSRRDTRAIGQKLANARQVKQQNEAARDTLAAQDPSAVRDGARAKDARAAYIGAIANERRAIEDSTRDRGPLRTWLRGFKNVPGGPGEAQKQAGMFQRMQQSAGARQGFYRPAHEYQTLRQFATNKAVTTGGYAASSALLYGGMQLGADVLDEAGDLQRELALVEAAFEETDAAANDTTFEGFRQEIRQISLESGVAVSRVAAITRQLAGAFSDPETGDLNFDRARKEVDVATKFSKLTGLPEQEITDSLTAIALAFDINFESIADNATFLSRTMGVSQTDLVRFTADLAPLGKELGFTAQQLTAFGGVAMKASGKSASAITEQFGRVLPVIQEKRAALMQMYADIPAAAPVLPAMGEAFAKGDIQEVLVEILRTYDKLDQTQQSALANIIGNPRELASFYAVLNRSGEAIRALEIPEDAGAGEFQRQWMTFTETVQYAMTELRRNIEDFGVALFQAGIDDALKMMIRLVSQLANAGKTLFEVLGTINEAFFGMPAKILVAMLALKAFGALQTKIAATAFVQNAGTQFGMLRGMGAAMMAGGAGGGFNPYQSLGAGVAGPVMMRPSTQRATQMFGLRRMVTRGAVPLPNPADVTGKMTAAAKGSVVAGAGTTMASTLAAAAPMIALVLTAVAIDKIMEYRSQIDAGAASIEEQSITALKAGMSPTELRNRIGSAAQGESFGETFGSHLLGRKTAGETSIVAGEKAIAKFEEDRTKAILEAFTTEANLDAFAMAAAAKRDKQKPEGTKYRKGRRGAPPKKQELLGADPKKAKEYALEIAKKYKDDPSPENLKLLTEIFNSPDLPKALKEAIGAVDQNIADVKDASDLVTENAAVALNVDTQKARYNAGVINIGTLLAAMDKQKVGMLRAITSARGDDIDIEMQALLAHDADRRALIMEEINRSSSLQDRIAAVPQGGQLTGKQVYESALAKFERIKNVPGVTEEELAEAALAVTEARNAAFQEMIDAAETPEEAMAIAEAGPDALPQEVLDALVLASNEAVAAVKAVYKLRRDALREEKSLMNKVGEVEAAEGVGKEIVANDAAEAAAIGVTQSQEAKKIGEGGQTPEQLEQTKKDDAEDAREAQIDKISAQYRRSRAGMRDEVQRARSGVDEVKAMRPHLDPEDPNALIKWEADLAEAEAALADSLQSRTDALADAQFDIRRVYARDDPMKLALIEMDAANAAMASAGGDPVKQAVARARQASAGFGISDASADVNRAKQEYSQTLAGDGSVEAAMIGVQLADQAVHDAAEGSAAKWRALAARVDAGRSLRESMFEAFSAQSDLAAALLEAAGDTIGAAQQGLREAERRYADAVDTGAPQHELDRLHAAVIRQQTSIRDAQSEDRLGDLAYLYEFDKITISGYIAKLQQELQAIPESQKEARREIERQIKALRETVGKDLSFNLPSNLKIPTLYEARRLGQSSPGGYQDNKTVNITLNANNAIDGEAAIQTIVDAVNGPPRVGVSPRAY